MEGKSKIGIYLTILGSVIGIVSITLALKQYHESKELREMQKELTALQLEKARNEVKKV